MGELEIQNNNAKLFNRNIAQVFDKEDKIVFDWNTLLESVEDIETLGALSPDRSPVLFFSLVSTKPSSKWKRIMEIQYLLPLKWTNCYNNEKLYSNGMG